MKSSLFGFGSWFGCWLAVQPMAAQIVPDTTLPVNSIVSPANNTPATGEGGNFVIEGGTKAGTNLFHSFQEFSIPTGGSAYFNNAADIQNIFGRVTGGNISRIDGMIKANGTANLFLLNPNGIIFGSSARLNIGGSFLASTANSIIFADRTSFGTIPSLDNTTLLTVSVPIGLQFKQQQNPLSASQNSAGVIRIEGSGLTRNSVNDFQSSEQVINYQRNLFNNDLGLQVKPGKSLMLFGGELIFDGGLIAAENGRISLAAISNGEISSRNNSSLLDSSFAVNSESSRGNIEIRKSSAIAASGEGGGNIQIAGDRVTVRDNSILAADTLGSENAGNFSIQADRLIVRDGSEISTSSYNAGAGGTLRILATDLVEVADTNANGFASNLRTTALSTGNAGNIEIATDRLILGDGGLINVSSIPFTELKNPGDPGNIFILADSILLFDRATISAISAGSARGNIILGARSIQLRQNSQVLANTVAENLDRGNNIAIAAETVVVLENSSIVANNFAGIGANIGIVTKALFVSADSQISSSGSTRIIGLNQFNRRVVSNAEVVNTETSIAQTCAARNSENSFIVAGRGGLPPNPSEMLSDEAVWFDLRDLSPANSDRWLGNQSRELTDNQITEARNWAIDRDGKISLTADYCNN